MHDRSKLISNEAHLSDSKGGETHMSTTIGSAVRALVSRLQLAREEGQGLVEYALILSLVSIAAILTLTSLGAAIVTVLGQIITAL